jgi:ABC-type branched-subunit amino acid transport system substrate-binding protein
VILPMTGSSADAGLSMERAVNLTRPADEREPGIVVVDSGGTAEGARAAAARAVSDGAELLLGPLFAREVPGVLAVAGGLPVVTFSNDGDLVGSGAFVLGLTASQGVSAVLAYARSRGVRRVTAIRDSDPWSRQSIEAARLSARSAGLELFEIDAAGAGTSDDIGAWLMAGSGGRLPDAVLFSKTGDGIAPLAARIAGLGLQLLGPSRWSDESLAFLTSVEGAWVAAPEPAAFGGFTQSFEATYRTAPGLLAGLAFDGATIARRLLLSGRVSREGLTAPEGFLGVLGAVRFSGDGRCTRELAIQIVNRGSLRVVGHLVGS